MTHHTSMEQHAPLSELEPTRTIGKAIWREAEWGEMRVGYETYLADYDDAELLRGLPDDRCQCPHWGNLLTGRMTVRYADREEVIKAGEIYYLAPGHTISIDAGTVLIEFSPRDEFRKLMKTSKENLARIKREMAGAWSWE